MVKMDFTGKTVLITGAGVGIGRKTAVLFAQAGAKVAVNSLTPANGNETLRQVQEFSQGIYIQGDVSLEADAKKMVEGAVKAFGKIDILVNNAGVVIPGALDATSEEDWDATMNVNVKGVFLVSKYAIQHMKAQGGGAIVNNASVVAVKGVKDRAAYSASKGAVVALTSAMAVDYLKDGIRVNCISPGTTQTPSLEQRISAFADPVQARKDFIDRQPMGRLGTDAEIAMGILFACCDEVAFLNGVNIPIDGGMSM